MDQIQEKTGMAKPGDVRGDVPGVEPDQELQESPEAGVELDNAEDMGELDVEDWDYQRPKRGQVRVGVILTIEDQEIVVDVGDKRDGIVPYADMQRMGPEALGKLKVGEEVPVYILRPEDRDGNLLVSLFLARQEQAWIRAQALEKSGKVWEGVVEGYNKGGLVVPFDDIRGFVPASQVPGFPRGLGQEERLQRLAEMTGETLMLKVIEVNRRKRRLILSASAAQRQWRQKNRERLLEELREGEVRSGRVSSLCSFGAFVDLGGADGLIHLSELSWRRVRHPRDVVSVGDEIEVYVLRLDIERKRIGLSLKRLQPEPWALVEEKYELGQLIEGTVTNVVDFGAFAEIEEGIEGLIHVSELTEGPISHPREVVKKGDLLLLRIIRIDARRKRLGLSLKRVLEAEWAEWAAGLAVAEEEEPESTAPESAAPEPEADDARDAIERDSGEPVSEAEDVEADVELAEKASAAKDVEPAQVEVEPSLETVELGQEGIEADVVESAPMDTDGVDVASEGVEEESVKDVADSTPAEADRPIEIQESVDPQVAGVEQGSSAWEEESEGQEPDQDRKNSEAEEIDPKISSRPDVLAVEDPEPAITE